MLKLVLKGLVIVLVLIAVAFTSAAIVIPKKRTFTQETEINASREVIWRILNDKASYPQWQDQLEKVEIKDAKNWLEYLKQGGDPIEFTENSSEEPVGLSLSFKMGESYKGSWTGELRRIGPKKTILRTTDKSEVDSVMMKVMMAMFFDTEEFAKGWNQKLKKRAETMEGGTG
jgi:uncharacterized protein YndB with AHSA1/START domain